jgi:nucleoside-diphosphate-sugar epimerase
MNVLVTGANGFIGRALCSRLASDNKVAGVDITGPLDGTCLAEEVAAFDQRFFEFL